MEKEMLTFPYEGDLWHVTLRGPIVARISCYIGGSHRQDVQFDDVPDTVKVRIIEKVKEIVNDTD